MSPRRVVFLSALIAAGTSVATTLLLRAADPDRAEGPAPRAGRSETPAMPGHKAGPAPADDASRIRKLEDDVARIARALEENDVPLAAPATRKDEILAGLMAAAPEQQLAVKEAVRQLARCGDAAVPDLVALLTAGRDVDYGGGYSFGGNMFTGGYPRLRTVLIDALRQIGTPAAREGLLNALGGSEDPLDYRDLLLMFSATKDGEMIRGISEMVPGMLAAAQKGGKAAEQLDWHLSKWIGRHNPEGAEDLLAELARGTLDEGRPDRGACAALIDVAPERAFLLVSRREEKDRQEVLRRFAHRMPLTEVSLANAARFYELAFSRMQPDRSTRMTLYASMPSRLDTSIASREERVADAKVLLDFLKRQLDAETDASARRMLERAVGNLEKSIAAEER